MDHIIHIIHKYVLVTGERRERRKKRTEKGKGERGKEIDESLLKRWSRSLHRGIILLEVTGFN